MVVGMGSIVVTTWESPAAEINYGESEIIPEHGFDYISRHLFTWFETLINKKSSKKKNQGIIKPFKYLYVKYVFNQ